MKILGLIFILLLTVGCGKSELSDISSGASTGGASGGADGGDGGNNGGGGGGPTYGTVTGVVTNAQNGSNIAGATVSIGALSTTTDGGGNYTINNVPTGVQTVNFSATGFVSQTDSTTVVDNQSHNVNMSLLTNAYAANKVIAVLSWGSNPTDLDSHLYVPTGQSSTYHIDYNNKGDSDGTLNTIPFAGLDTDEVQGYGPETIAISWNGSALYYPRVYRYFVHNYSNDLPINASNAQIRVYRNGTLIQTFTPPAGCTGIYWHVFDMAANSSITTVNTCSGIIPAPLY